MPLDEERLLTGSLPGHLILQAAQQTMREMREEQINDLDTALKRLNEERNRCEKLLQLNVSLKEQLEESHQTNESLTNDLQKLSSEWDSLREEMTLKEDEWKEEELAFNEYYMSEHNRLLELKRDVASVKRLYAEMKFSTERDLSKLRNEMSNATNDMVMACSNTSFLLKMQAAAASSVVANKEFGQSTMEEARKVELSALKERFESLQSEARAKEEKIHQLTKEVRLFIY